MSHRVFVSHAHGDALLAEKIRDDLVAVGAAVFLDRYELEYGDRFRDKILPELVHADEFVALLTPASLRRAWVAAEMGISLHLKKRIVAVLYGVTDEDLRTHGLLSLVGDMLHVYDTRDLPAYYEQVHRRVAGGRQKAT